MVTARVTTTNTTSRGRRRYVRFGLKPMTPVSQGYRALQSAEGHRCHTPPGIVR